MEKTNACTGKVSFWRNWGAASVEVVQDDWLYWLIWKFKFSQFLLSKPAPDHQWQQIHIRRALQGGVLRCPWHLGRGGGHDDLMITHCLTGNDPPFLWKTWLHHWIKKTNAVDFAIPLWVEQSVKRDWAYKESLFHHVCRQGYHQRHPMTTFNFKEKLHVWKDHTMLLRNERNRNS